MLSFLGISIRCIGFIAFDLLLVSLPPLIYNLTEALLPVVLDWVEKTCYFCMKNRFKFTNLTCFFVFHNPWIAEA